MDKGTGKKQDITITGASTLPGDEVERMVSEAEKFAKEDKEKRDVIDTKNQTYSLIYQTEKQLKEPGESVLGELKDAISGGSTQAMKDAMTALNQEVMQIAGPTPDAGASSPESSDKGPDGDVIDAGFTGSKWEHGDILCNFCHLFGHKCRPVSTRNNRWETTKVQLKKISSPDKCI